MSRVIGILGGMGPRATVAFEQLLINQFPGQDQDIPCIVTINDGAIPDRSQYILGRGASPVPLMQRNLEKLEALGAEVICIPCNTASMPVIFDQLRPRKSKLLYIPTEVSNVLQKTTAKKVLLLATQGTVQSGMYQAICQANGMSCLNLAPQHQRMVDMMILAVKQNHLTTAQTLATTFSSTIHIGSYDAVILGCTELPLLSEHFQPQPTIVIDTLAVLAEACAKSIQVTKEYHDDTRPIYAYRNYD